jgi:RimJ/RimL family protein N-acetyltransferase
MDPASLEIPERIESERLFFRPPHPDDARDVNVAVRDSIDRLRPWMIWAQHIPSLEETQNFVREAQAKFAARQDLGLQIRRKSDGVLVGMSGFHNIDWAVPKLEIGYWARTNYTGQGYVTEAVLRLTEFAFATLGANRVEIRMDDRNERSWRVAERAGFTLEGILRNDERTPLGELRDTRIYAKVRLVDGSIV